MPVPGRDAYPNIHAQSMKKDTDTYGLPLDSGLGRDSPISKLPRYEEIRKNLEMLEELAYNTNLRVSLIVENIAGTQPDDGSNIKCKKDHECLYDFIHNSISDIRKYINSINEQLDRL